MWKIVAGAALSGVKSGFSKVAGIFGGGAARAEASWLASPAGAEAISKFGSKDAALAMFNSAQAAPSLLSRGLKLFGLVGAAGIGVDAVRGQNSLLGQGVENIAEAIKNTDSQTDMGGLFTRIGEFFKNLVILFKNLPAIISGNVKAADLFTAGAVPPTGPTTGASGTTSPSPSTAPTAGLDLSGAPIIGAGALTGAALGATLLRPATAGAPTIITAGAAAGGTGFFTKAFNTVVGVTPLGRIARAAVLGGGLAMGGSAAFADEANPAQPALTDAPAAQTIGGFVSELGQGVGSVFTLEEWKNGNNLDAGLNNGGAAVAGAGGAISWIGGQLVDTFDTALDYSLDAVGVERDFNDDYSSQWSTAVNEGIADGLGVDMDGAWAKTFNVAGGIVGGGGVAGAGVRLVGAATNIARVASVTNTSAAINVAGFRYTP